MCLLYMRLRLYQICINLLDLDWTRSELGYFDWSSRDPERTGSELTTRLLFEDPKSDLTRDETSPSDQTLLGARIGVSLI